MIIGHQITKRSGKDQLGLTTRLTAQHLDPARTVAEPSESECRSFFNSPRVHFMRNPSRALRVDVLAQAGKGHRRLVSAWIATAFAEVDADAARKQWRSVADQLRPRVPKLATLMDTAEDVVSAFMSYPKEHRAKIHSTNPLKRLNSEIKRRIDVVGIFLTKQPSPAPWRHSA